MTRTKYHRREDYSGKPMLINLPTEGYTDSGEGGLAFYFAIPYKDGRCVCLPGGGVSWGYTDVLIYPQKYTSYPKYNSKEEYYPMSIDGGLLIGSTGLSLWNDSVGEYFHAKYSDLTDDGKNLYNLLKKMYGQVDIITLLDT